VALAIKNHRPLVLLDFDPGPLVVAAEQAGRVLRAADPLAAIEGVRNMLTGAPCAGGGS
jgi:hypothetical protein